MNTTYFQNKHDFYEHMATTNVVSIYVSIVNQHSKYCTPYPSENKDDGDK